MQKAYLLNLIFDVWRCQMWFTAEDTPEVQSRWNEARSKLDEIGDRNQNPQHFAREVTEVFQEAGFVKIHK